ncbi:hypothetical protein V8E54_002725 [Elaphomyces granulatus]
MPRRTPGKLPWFSEFNLENRLGYFVLDNASSNTPLLNFCGTAGSNMPPQICLAFLSGEKEEDYARALNCYRKMLAQHNIAEPKCFMACESECVAKCKRNLKTKEAFQEFYEAWSTVVESETLEAYEENLASFKKLNTKAVNYCVKKMANKVAHLAILRLLESHASIKAYLTNSRGDHKAFFESVCNFWEDQHRLLIREAIDQEKIVDEKGKILLRGPPTNLSCAGLSRHSGFLATIKHTKNNRIQAVSHSPILALTGTTIEALFILKTLVESFLILLLLKAKEGRRGVKAKERIWANRVLGEIHLCTLRERAYLRSLHLSKLAEQIDEDELDNKDNEIHENGEKDFNDIDEVINNGNSQRPSTSPRPSRLPVGRQFELPFSPPKHHQIAGINEPQLTDRDAEGETD